MLRLGIVGAGIRGQLFARALSGHALIVGIADTSAVARDNLACMVPRHPSGLPRLLAAPAATGETTLRAAACLALAEELELDV